MALVFLLIAAGAACLLALLFIIDFDDGTEEVGWVSVKSFLLFGVGFGAAGAICAGLEQPLWTSIGLGCVWGLALAGLGILLMRQMRGMETDTSTPPLVGRIGWIAEPLDPVGVINVMVNGEVQRIRAESPTALVARGTPVKIDSFDGTTATVRPVEKEIA